MSDAQIKRIAEGALKHAVDLVTFLFPQGQPRGREYVVGNLAGDPGDSLSINLDTGEWADFAQDARGGDLVSLWAAAKRVNQFEAATEIALRYGFNFTRSKKVQKTIKTAKKNTTEKHDEISPAFIPLPIPQGATPPPHDPTKRWMYRDADGNVLMYVDRIDRDDGSKDIVPLTFGKYKNKTGWHRKSIADHRPLFNLDVLTAQATAPVLVVEGEKTACAAAMLFPDWVVTTWPGGSKSVRKADWKPLIDRFIVIWPDHDEPGTTAALAISKKIYSLRQKQYGETDSPQPVRMVAVPDEWPQGWDLADEPPELITVTDLRRMVNDAEPINILPERSYDTPEKLLQEFNERHAVISVGGTVSILWENLNPITKRIEIQYLTEKDFKLLYRDREVEIKDPLGDRTKYEPATQWWLKHPKRRIYHNLTFIPGVSVAPFIFNLWRGFATQPDRSKSCTLFHQHILENICANDIDLYGWVVTWMADAVQNPQRRPGTALVLRGRQGTGKGVFCHQFGALFGQHFIHVTNSRHFLGNFNAHLADCILLYADEAFWAGDKQSEGILKGLITEPRFMIEYKYKNPVLIPNYIRLIMTSNSDWVIPAGLEERRFAVLDVSDVHMQDHDYFRKIIDEMNNGGREALMAGLLDCDTSAVNIRQVPNTKALNEQKLYSMDSVTRFWYERIDEGWLLPEHTDWETQVEVDKFFEYYLKCSAAVGERRHATKIAFGHKLQNLCPKIQKIRIRRVKAGTYSTERVYAYEIPPLEECVQAFTTATGYRVNDSIPPEPVNNDASFPF